MSASETMWFGCADQNGKSETPERKHEAQLTILPLQHSKARTLPSRLIKPVPVQQLSGVRMQPGKAQHFPADGVH